MFELLMGSGMQQEEWRRVGVSERLMCCKFIHGREKIGFKDVTSQLSDASTAVYGCILPCPPKRDPKPSQPKWGAAQEYHGQHPLHFQLPAICLAQGFGTLSQTQCSNFNSAASPGAFRLNPKTNQATLVNSYPHPAIEWPDMQHAFTSLHTILPLG